MTTVVGLGGGIGASRLWRPLAQAVGPENLTLVVNTADDFWQHGLRICPDLDTTLYALSGRQDPDRGWGVRDESFRCMEALRELGHDVWFNLGDLDLATHLLRTGLLREGLGPVEVTARLAAGLGVRTRVLPMSEQEVTTTIETADGRRLHYEEFLVLHQAALLPYAVHHEGLDRARAAPGVLDAIESADLVVLGPSNPVASMLPILGLPEVRDALRRRRDRVTGVSPIVSGVPFADPGEARRGASRSALLRAIGVPETAAGIAGLYGDICSRFLFDLTDIDQAGAIGKIGVEPVAASLLLHRGAPAVPLLNDILAARSDRGKHARLRKLGRSSGNCNPQSHPTSSTPGNPTQTP
jgi:LPPG:FO 2-phospho-L-lactate transferase